MGLNISGLKNFQQNLEERSSGNSYFNQGKIGEETDIRILPPVASLNGMYFLERTVYWIKKKPYVSPATFGEPCPIEQELEKIKEDAQNDPDLQALIDSDLFQKRSDFLIPILLLNCDFADGGNMPSSIKVVDEKPKILQCGPQLLKAINKVATSRNFQNGTEDGFTDREKGFGLILSKKGTGLKTEYSATGWPNPNEMDEKYYTDIPDVVAETRKNIHSDEYYIGVLNNYFYGDPMPEKPKKEEDAAGPKTASRRSRTTEPAQEPAKDETPKTATRGRAANTTQSEPKEEEQPKTTARGRTGNRDLMSDLNNMK